MKAKYEVKILELEQQLADIKGGMAYRNSLVGRLEAQNLALLAAAMRYQWLCANRDVLLITGIFGNGCVNKTISDVNNFIDSKLSIQPSTDLLAERDRKRDAKLLRLVAKLGTNSVSYADILQYAHDRLSGEWVPELGDAP